jgi:hypothetical protein
MADINWGRHTADLDEPKVLFLIGMRVNRLLAVGQWLPVAHSMGRMLRELAADPNSGFLGARTFLSGRTVLVQQYWRSTDDLLRYAHDSSRLHRPAWTAFFKQIGVGEGAAVGIWHETVVLQPGQVETIYGNMPPFGLGQAIGTTPATGTRDTAAKRLGRAA